MGSVAFREERFRGEDRIVVVEKKNGIHHRFILATIRNDV